MDETLTPEKLRAIFLSTQESDATRIMAICISLALIVVVLWLVRRRSLQEEYTPIWMGVAGLLLLVTLRIDILRSIAGWIGAWTTSSVVFFLGEFFLVAICLNYAVRLSRSSIRQKNLAQEVAVLKAQVDKLERRLADGR